MENSLLKTSNHTAQNKLIEARQRIIAEQSDVSFRLEWIKSYREIDFVNDAKSSNVIMSIEAIEQCANKVVWICHDDLLVRDFNLVKLVMADKIKAIIYLNQKTNATLEQLTKGLIKNTLRLNHLEEAVAAALSFASNGDTILFSPASPAYLNLDTYYKRGTEFNNLIAKL